MFLLIRADDVSVLENILMRKTTIKGKCHSLCPNLLWPCFSLALLIVDCILSPGICWLLHFYHFLVCLFDVGWHFSLLTIVCYLQHAPDHPTPQYHPANSSYDVWEGNMMFFVAFGGSCVDISTIADSSTQQQCKKSSQPDSKFLLLV